MQGSRRTIGELLIFLVLSILLPLLVLGGVILRHVDSVERARIEQEAVRAASGLEGDIDREISGIVATLTGLASSPALKGDNLEVFYNQALGIAQLINAPILLRDAKSHQQLINTRLPFGTPLPFSPPLQQTAQMLIDKQPYVTDLVVSAVTKRYLVSIAVPVIDGGEVVRVLVASLEPERLLPILRSQQVGNIWNTAVTDRTGRLIARSNDIDLFVGAVLPAVSQQTGAAGSHRTLSIDGIDILRGYRTMRFGWTASAFAPASVVDAPFQKSWLLFSAIGALVLAAAIPVAYLFARRISSSFQTVTRIAQRLEQGAVIPLTYVDVAEAQDTLVKLHATSLVLRERTRQLAESASRFRSTFDQAAVGFEQIGLDGRWVMLNNRMCEMLGYTREECLALSPWQLTHPDDHLIEAPRLERVLRGEQPTFLIEKRYRRKSGDYLWVRAATSLVFDIDKYPLYFVSIVEDISAVDEARSATAKLAALVMASDNAILSLDNVGRIETCNPGTDKLLGVSGANLIGQPFEQLASPERVAEFRDLVARGLAGETFRVETELHPVSHSAIAVGIGVAPVRTVGGAVTALSITIDDIRERREWANRLLLLNRELHHRVKNSLAVVQSVSNQSIKSSASLAEFKTAFQGRLQALAASNDILVETSWEGASIEAILDRQLLPLLSAPHSQLRKSGGAVQLPADLTVPVGLALHELGTNALKYGALAQPGGYVEVTWTSICVADVHSLKLTWREFGISGLTTPHRRGFGTTLITRGIPRAKVRHEILSDGAVCEMEIQLVA